MKIEIAENLIQSYLKHIEGCRIVQTNWKTSGKWTITEYDKERAKNLYNEINKSDSFKGVFTTSSFEQEIKQAEIDVLGLNTIENSVYGIEVAFHKAGINYKGENAKKIIQKIIRTILVQQCYFKGFDKFNSFFVTPKAGQTVTNEINDLIEKTIDIIGDECIAIKFICNDEFFSTFVEPLLQETADENDTSELFLRAVKLLNLSKKHNEEISIKSVPTEKEKFTVDGMKIGQFVQYSIRKAFEQNLITEDEIKNLQNINYSKDVFKQNLEVLRNKDKSITDKSGIKRYYTTDLFCGDYFLTSQWTERHWNPFKEWLKSIGYAK
jgi:hypothetical protein